MNNNNENKFSPALVFLSIIGSITFLSTFVYVIYVLRAVHVSSLVDIRCIDGALCELTRLQGKIIDDVVITFLTTLLVALFISIGIFLINKYEKAFRRHKKEIEDIKINLTKDINDNIKTIESIESIFNIYPFVISIYLLSNNINKSDSSKQKDESNKQKSRNSNKTEPKGKENELFYSVCYQIDRSIKNLILILEQIENFDNKNKEILLYYIGNTLYNLNSYIKQNNLDSTYANEIIKKIEDIKNQIEKLKVIDSKANFKLRQ